VTAGIVHKTTNTMIDQNTLTEMKRSPCSSFNNKAVERACVSLADFNGREGSFGGINSECDVYRRERVWNPRKVWLLHQEQPLAMVALMIMSIGASEAAVERTFSAQSAVHTKARNSLHPDSVQAEMHLKFNLRLLRHPTADLSYGGCKELTLDDDTEEGEDFQLFHFIASEDEKKECAEILQQHEQQNSEEMIDVEEEEEKQEPEARAAAVASASSRRRLRRDQSEIFSDLSGFIDWFILDAGLTASTGWNSDLRCRLDAASRKLVNSPVLSKLEETVRARLSH
jgi:hypothetical protein